MPTDNERAADPRQVGGKTLGHPINEVILRRIATEVGERKHNDGKMRWRKRAGSHALRERRWAGFIHNHGIDPNGTADVFEVQLAQIGEPIPEA